jgi:hypothetical protein
MDTPITYTDLLNAVSTAHEALTGTPTDTDTWDRILPTLIAAHTLCGGTTRTLIRNLFHATYHTPTDVTTALQRLHQELRPRRRRTRTTPHNPLQLTLPDDMTPTGT